MVRALAERPCSVCAKPNGYHAAIYAYPTRCGHADCIDDAHQKALHRFIDALADFAVEAWKEGRLTADPSSEDTPETSTPAGEDGSSSKRYTLPEFDIDVVIPASSRRSPSTLRARGKIGR
jgi:hypothetical protein